MEVLEESTNPKAAEALAGTAILCKAFSFPVFLGALLVAGVCAAVHVNLREVPTRPCGYSYVSIIDGDTWFHILVGEDILKARGVKILLLVAALFYCLCCPVRGSGRVQRRAIWVPECGH